MPAIKLLSGENVRQGFIEKADFDKLLTHLPSDDDRDIIGFLYHSGWRSGEAKSLEWRDVDADIIRLRRKTARNGKPSLLPLIGELKEIIERRRQKASLLPVCLSPKRKANPQFLEGLAECVERDRTVAPCTTRYEAIRSQELS